MKKTFLLALALFVTATSASAQSSGRDTTPSTDVDITPQSSAPGSGAGAGSGPGGTGTSSTKMGSSSNTGIEKKFGSLDTDKDGFINKPEAEKSNSLSHSLDQADTNKDGKLSMKEYQAIVDDGVGSSGAGGGVNKSLPSRGPDSSNGGTRKEQWQ